MQLDITLGGPQRVGRGVHRVFIEPQESASFDYTTLEQLLVCMFSNFVLI